ncbi:MAG TPA: hypothetical protein VE959_04630 [Bryobacteraceae bacterium]|nr:hypothetical protein [Bryobacteraceae bacterium]
MRAATLPAVLPARDESTTTAALVAALEPGENPRQPRCCATAPAMV